MRTQRQERRRRRGEEGLKQHFQGRQSFAIGSSHSLHFLQTNSNAMLHYIWAPERYVNQLIRDPINNSKDCLDGQLTK